MAEINGQTEKKYPPGAVRPYILDLLSLGLCRFFFRGSFAISDELLLASYNTEGYRKLTSLKHFGTEDIFTVVISVLSGAATGRRHYIFPEDYEIDADSIYVDKSISAVKLIFTPSEKNRPLPEKLIQLLLFLRNLSTVEGLAYIDSAVSFIEENGDNDHAVLHHLEKLRREIYLCSVE